MFMSLRSVVAIAVFGIAVPAGAAILTINDEGFPPSTDGMNFTIDTDTGIEWLDPSASTNISAIDMAEHLKPGETYHGLRHATTDMVRVFFTNLGLDVSNWPFQTRVDDNGESGFAAQEAVGNTSDGSTSGYMDGSGSAIRQIATITAWSRDDASGATSVSGSGNALPGIAREDWGHWLVRLFGDYNLNGVVDAPDYIVWRDTFGSTADLAADGNGNGRVDAPDYNVWRDFFDNRFPDPVQVPEPSSIVLLLSAAVAIGWRRRKP